MKKSKVFMLVALVSVLLWSCNNPAENKTPVKDLMFGAAIGTAVPVEKLSTLNDGFVNIISLENTAAEGTDMKFSFSVPADASISEVKVSPATAAELPAIAEANWGKLATNDNADGFDKKADASKDATHSTKATANGRDYYTISTPTSIAWKVNELESGKVKTYHPSAIKITYKKVSTDKADTVVRVLVSVTKK